MPKSTIDTQSLNMKNTKQELLDAYYDLVIQMEENEKNELKPEKKIAAKEKEQILAAVDGFSIDRISNDIINVKNTAQKTLTDLSDKLTAEVEKLNSIKKAIAIKEGEFKEIYDIEKSALTLAALIEAQHKQKEVFESNLTEEKEALTREISETREHWKKEKDAYLSELKSANAAEIKVREREKEEYHYSFEREKQLEKNQFEDEKIQWTAKLDMLKSEMKMVKENTERELTERERIINEKEIEFQKLKTRVDLFPDELSKAVDIATKGTAEKLKIEFQYKEKILQHENVGEKNVLKSRIESLEKTVNEQNIQIEKLSKHQEQAYQKVQDVAVKAIEGASNSTSYADLSRLLGNHERQMTQQTTSK